MIRFLKLVFVLFFLAQTVNSFAQVIHNTPIIGFEENKGQITDENGSPHPEILFRLRNQGTHVLITQKGLTYFFINHIPNNEKENERSMIEWSRFDMTLSGASIEKQNVFPEKPSDAFINYYTNNADGILNIKTFEKVTIKNIYPGIDWILYTNDHGFEYDFVLHPGANANLISMNYKGQEKLELTAENEIKISTALGVITEKKPYSYFKENKSISISSEYTLHDQNIAFNINANYKNETIVIDPKVVWSTYFGGNSTDGDAGSTTIDTDNKGNLYLLTKTTGGSYPLLQASLAGTYYQTTTASGFEVCGLSKFNAKGVLVWSTFYGKVCVPKDIKADDKGNLFLCGYFSYLSFTNPPALFPTKAPASNPTATGYTANNISLNGSTDLFVARFDTSGNYIWGTLYGGSDHDCVNSLLNLAVDKASNVYVAGATMSSNFPIFNHGGTSYNLATTPTSFATYQYIFRLDKDCNRQWSTIFNKDLVYIYDLEESVDGRSIYIAGSAVNVPTVTPNPWVDPGNGAYYKKPITGTHAFVIELDTSCTIQWGTIIGNSGGFSQAYSVSNNSKGELFLGGRAFNATFPIVNPGGGAYNQSAFTTPSGGMDFFMKFDNTKQLIWSTLYGGSTTEFLTSIASDKNSNLYFTGYSSSADLPVQVNSSFMLNETKEGGNDAVLGLFDASLQQKWSTFYGGPSTENGTRVIVDDYSKCVYYSGEVTSTSGVTTINLAGAYNQANNGGGSTLKDTYIVKLCPLLILKDTVTPPYCLADSMGGFATVHATEGTKPYTYSWSTTPVQTDSTATGLKAGDYTVTVTDANAQTETIVVTVGAPQPVTLNVTGGSVSCGGANGTITATTTGTNTPYTYSWNSSSGALSQTAATATGLSAGTYTVTTTDSKGCTSSKTASITSSGGPTSINSSTASDCSIVIGTGTATVNPSGGTQPYTYSWSGVASAQTANTATGLAAGIYTVVINDKNNCSSTTTVSVSFLGSLGLSIIPSTVPCTGNQNVGTITASGQSGYGPYTFSWSNNAGNQTTQTATGLGIGTYTVKVTDNGGCTATTTVSISAANAPTITTNGTQTGCNILNPVGTAIANATGGASGYTYSWSALGQTTQTATGLANGTYTVTVTDSKGCSATATYSVSTATGFTISPSSTSANCTSASGSASVTPATSGYTYSWSNGATTSNINNVIAGTYTVTVSDANGCSDSKTVVVASVNTLSVSVTPTEESCSGIKDGSAAATITGGQAPYTYSWSDPQNQTAATATGLTNGIYSVVIADGNGCTQTQTVSVALGTGPTVSITGLTTISPGETTQLIASGGSTYVWDIDSTLSCSSCSNPFANPNESQWYIVTITDSKGCSNTDSIFVTVELKCGDFFIPTAFSPNGDGINDVFRIRTNCIREFSLQIFDRWGEKVFESDDILIGWDGYYRGQLQNTGVFVYQVKATLKAGDKVEKKGNVTLVR